MSDVKQKIDQTIEAIKTEINNTTQKEWGIAGVLSLLLCVLFNALTKHKEERIISFSLIVYAAALTLSAVVVRVKSKVENQYAWSVVFLSLIGLFIGIRNGASLFLGFVPPLINHLRRELKHS